MIRSLKDKVYGDLYVGGTLVRAMLADSVVDELHLFVYPLTRGSGPRLLHGEAAPGNVLLAACESYENGVVYLATDRRREADAAAPALTPRSTPLRLSVSVGRVDTLPALVGVFASGILHCSSSFATICRGKAAH